MMFSSQGLTNVVIISALTTFAYSFYIPGRFSALKDNVGRRHHANQTKLLILSLDGFHYQYLYRFQNELSFLKNSIAGSGVFAERGMTSTFTTQTLPCHYTMATGLYHESHGIVGNYFHDPSVNETYMIGSPTVNEEKWYNGDPLWSVAVKQNKKFGVIAWIASEVDFKNSNRKNPTIMIGFNKNHKLEDKLTTAYDWMFNSSNNLDGVMVYHNEPDTAGHWNGAGSEAVRQKLIKINSDLKSFFKKLDDNRKRDNINVVIVADHGMANVTQPHLIISDHGVNLNQLSSFADGGGTLLKIFPRNFTAEFELVEKLSQIANQTRGFTLYRRHDMPNRWHYKNNERIGQLIIVANEGQLVFNNRDWIDDLKGEHGFDNNLDSMKPLFAATGPSFQRKVIHESFDQVNVFSLFCHLMNITAPKNNGSLTPFLNYLRDQTNSEKNYYDYMHNRWSNSNDNQDSGIHKHSRGSLSPSWNLSGVVTMLGGCIAAVGYLSQLL